MMKFIIRLFFLTVFLYSVNGSCFAESILKEESKRYFKEGIEALKYADYSSAITAFRKALVFYPESIKLHNNLGVAYANIRETELAEKEFKYCIVLDPDYELAYKNLAVLYGEKGEYELSYYFWKKSLGISVHSPYFIEESELQEKD